MRDAAAIRGWDRLHRTPGVFEVFVCADCGSGVTRPPASPPDLAAFYPDEYGPYDAAGGPAHLVSATIQRWQGWRALRTAPLRTIAGMTPGRALDVGCGRGDLGAMLIRRGWRVTGVEPSTAAAAAARQRGIDARHGTLATAKLPPRRHHVAVFQHSLEHVGEPVDDLSRTRDALAEHGLVLVTVPNFACWQGRRFASSWFHLDLPRHRVHFSPEGLVRALERAGLEVLALETSSSSVGLPGSLQYRLFGHCLVPRGLGLRIALGLASVSYPLALLLDRVSGAGDLLHAVARTRCSGGD